jgi:CRP/FNR family cyclic AMP-dependent transcriptional regulator
MRGRIIEIHKEGANRIGLVEFDGKRRAVYLSLIPAALVGDDVLFHAGFATECIPNRGTRSAARQSAISLAATPKTRLETSGAYRLLNELDPPQLRKLIEIAQDRHFEEGDIIFRSGATSSFLHLIVSGDVALEAITDGPAQQVQTVHSGDAMGWSALSGNSLTHFQAHALSPVATVALPGAQLRALCDADPVLGYALMKRLVDLAAERLDAIRAKLAERPLACAAG